MAVGRNYRRESYSDAGLPRTTGPRRIAPLSPTSPWSWS